MEGKVVYILLYEWTRGTHVWGVYSTEEKAEAARKEAQELNYQTRIIEGEVDE